MKIVRHPVDLQRIATIFQARREDLEESLERAREESAGLDSFYRDAKRVFLTGSVLAPDSPEVAWALRLATQGGTALFMFQRIEDPPRPLILGEGPPVIYTEPVDRSSADFPTWIEVFYLCLITRESKLSDEVCRVPNEVFRHSDIVGATDADYSFADLLRAVWMHGRFTTHPAFVHVEAECRYRAASRTSGAQHIRRMTLPFLKALRHLEQHDEVGFAKALMEALDGHKEFWSSEKYREEFNGFVSLELTAVAALAWDQGMCFEVESDYLPMSWVRGDHFHERHSA